MSKATTTISFESIASWRVDRDTIAPDAICDVIELIHTDGRRSLIMLHGTPDTKRPDFCVDLEK